MKVRLLPRKCSRTGLPAGRRSTLEAQDSPGQTRRPYRRRDSLLLQPEQSYVQSHAANPNAGTQEHRESIHSHRSPDRRRARSNPVQLSSFDWHVLVDATRSCGFAPPEFVVGKDLRHVWIHSRHSATGRPPDIGYEARQGFKVALWNRYRWRPPGAFRRPRPWLGILDWYGWARGPDPLWRGSARQWPSFRRQVRAVPALRPAL
jgi:hypothetical protein